MRGIESQCDMCYFCSKCRKSLVMCAIKFVCTHLQASFSARKFVWARESSFGRADENHELSQAGKFYLYLVRPVFFYFSFYRPSRPKFLEIEKKIKENFFNFIFLFPSDSCQYSTGVHLCFSVLSFLLLPGWLNYPQWQHLVRYCHFYW